MRTLGKIIPGNNRINMVVFAAVFLFLIDLFNSSSAASSKPLSQQEILRQGERIYRDGILPSGQTLQGYVKDDVRAPGSSFSCVSCHMRSGLGSLEGGVFTTPTNGRTLYEPRDLPGAGNNRQASGMSMADKKNKVQAHQPPSARSAYSDATLARVLREGVDPQGRNLDPVMPRYLLDEADMAILVTYLKNLSMEFSPGVDKDCIRFATIIAPDLPAGFVKAMMDPLESFVKASNKQQQDYETRQVRFKEKKLDPTYRRVKLLRWQLEGKPETWRSQLEEYYRREPVFALIAGMSPTTWQPMHEFSESFRIPCILPDTEFPVLSESDWYTLYFSKGYSLEGAAAANYLKSLELPATARRIVQVVMNTSQGQLLAEGFTQELVYQGYEQPVVITLHATEVEDPERIKKILDRENPDVLALWIDDAALKKVAPVFSARGNRPLLLTSASILGKGIWTLPEPLRSRLFITYPYRLPQDEKRFERFWPPADKGPQSEAKMHIIQGRTYAALRVLTQALRDLKGNFYRDHLFDVIGMRSDIEFPLYERLSFGPGQRYASKGCYVVQLTAGDNPQLVKRSEWVIH